MTVVTAMNLATSDKLSYTCTPREAVIAAHAQSLGDYNTWNYAQKYNHLVLEGPRVYNCGNFGVFKDGQQF